MRKTIKSILLGAVAVSLAMTSGCGKGNETGSESKSNSTADESTASYRRPLRAPEDYGKVIALTFDDGPNTTTTAQVLDKLEEYGVTASFFVVGDNITEDSAKVMKRAYDMGCEIHNHSKTHSDMTTMTEEQIKEDIKFTSDKVEEITGEAPKFFRPPYIAVNQTMFDSIDMPFISGYGSEDYNDKVDIEERAKRTIDQAKDGSIILLHDTAGNVRTVAALDIIIPKLQDEGYEFVTMTELFHAKEVEISPDAEIIYSYAQQTEMYG